MRLLKAEYDSFAQDFRDLIALSESNAGKVKDIVADIIADVRERGVQAIVEYTKQFDYLEINHFNELRIDQHDLEHAWRALDEATQNALKIAHDRIKTYGEQQKIQSWSYQEADGSELGQVVNPLDSVGIYVPGGKAAYPSSVMMNAIPAKVAGVPRIIMVVPTPKGLRNQLVLATAHLCGVDEVWSVGGAQAVAMLAYGCEGFEPVDKITGPGNQYVAEAKRMVFGRVGIDMIAGPSEVVVIADQNANPEWIVADLFAQAEHDEMAQSILITDSPELAEQVQSKIKIMLEDQPRKSVISTALENRGAIIVAQNIEQCIRLSNQIAPEHLEIMFANVDDYLPLIKHAGAIFVGEYSNEVFGDYCAGTNHVLPTAGTARFSSPLGVYDFQKRTSVLRLSEQGAKKLSPIADKLATGEGLSAHALSARLRGQ